MKKKNLKKFSKEEIDKFIGKLDFSKIESGLIPVITQDYETNTVLMIAFANEEAVRKTLETGYAHYYSRSRDVLWRKGETSGHVQEVQNVYTDCDMDSLLLKVKQIGGAACHEGYESCFFHELDEGELKICAEKCFDPDVVYKK